MDIDDDDFTSTAMPGERKRLTRQRSYIPAKKSKPLPLRKLFGRNEDIYVMDAKIAGNIGRYFNVSTLEDHF